jgi:hypothetical protein
VDGPVVDHGQADARHPGPLQQFGDGERAKLARAAGCADSIRAAYDCALSWEPSRLEASTSARHTWTPVARSLLVADRGWLVPDSRTVSVSQCLNAPMRQSRLPQCRNPQSLDESPNRQLAIVNGPPSPAYGARSGRYSPMNSITDVASTMSLARKRML